MANSLLTNGNQAKDERINLTNLERYVSMAIGIRIGFSGLTKIFRSPLSSMLKLGAGGYLINRAVTGHCDLYARAGKKTVAPVNVNIKSTFTINKPRTEVYNFWRKLDNLPLFMNHLQSVEVLDNERSRWVLKLPARITAVSWDAEIVMDVPGELIGWSSLPGSVLDNAGKVRFRESFDETSTVVDVVISYQPPAGGLGASLAHIINPVFKKMVDEDVQNFKQYMDIEGLTADSE